MIGVNPTTLGADAQSKRDLWLFLLFAFVVLAVGIGLRGPWPADEPRFVLVAKQMWESGDWLFPHRGRELYPDKPPVYFWLLNLCYAVVRDWNWAFLLPSLFAALGTLALTADLGRRLWTPRIGLWAAAAVLCAVQFVYQSKRAQIDPTIVFMITLSCYGLIRHLLLGPNWRWYWWACFVAGLGIATKGVGFLPLLMLPAYAAMRGLGWPGCRANAPASAARWAGGFIALLAGVGLWFVPMLVTALSSGNPEHQAYLDNILFKQTATRYVAAWHHNEPFWYFGEVIALFWMPFSLALPWLIAPWRAAWRERDARVWLPLVWVVLVLLFFSASPGKRDMYILPALPLLALAAAPFLETLLQRRGLRITLIGFVVLLGALFFGAGLAALIGDPSFEIKLEAQRGLLGDSQADRIWWTLAAIGASLLLAALWSRLRRVTAAIAITTLALWTGYGVGIAPALDDESSGRQLMQQARDLAGPYATIGLVHWTEQNLLQAVGPVTEFGFKASFPAQWNEAMAWLRADPSRWVLTQQESLPFCVQGAQTVGAANRRHWYLLNAAAASACPSLIRLADLPEPSIPE